ncbi:MAG TPA: amidohydrolase family protein [Puia sp.]|nr:amidohydrolase family protein [Puia sp.]
MRLLNVCFPGGDEIHDLWIEGGKIVAVQPPGPSGYKDPNTFPAAGPALDLRGALAFPGLINSHDHLDFNLFPALGNRMYRNYKEWGRDIHANNRASIQPILKIPQELRTQWGVYRNLLNGFTTVVNHGARLHIDNPLITVFQDCYCLHSVGFEPRWRWKLNHPAKRRRPFAIHVGEGTDTAAIREIDELIRWNLFRRPLIGIHAVAMNYEQASAFHAVVWCPASNYFLLGRTARVDRLLPRVPIVFGTDSTLTGSWNIWGQLRLARDLRLATDQELLAMLTGTPADAWGLPHRASLKPGSPADLVIARRRAAAAGMDAFFGLNPEDFLLVMQEGQIRVFDPSLLASVTEQGLAAEDFHPTRPGGKYVAGDLPGLMADIARYCPEVSFPDLP